MVWIGIHLNSILRFAMLSDLKMRNVLLALIYYALTIITASKVFSKTGDKIVHFTSLQRSFFDMCWFMLYSYFRLISHKIEVTKS